MTTETDIVEMRRRLEMLKLARHMINDEYLKERASAYTQWATDSDQVWRSQGVKLPFPPVPAMPSEADVVARALRLYNHVNAQTATAPATSTPAAVPTASTPVSVVAPVATTSEPVIEPEPELELELELVPEPTAELELEAATTPEPVVEPVPVPVSKVETVYTEQVKKIFETPAPDIAPPLDQAVESLVLTETENHRALVPMIRGLIEKGFLQLGHRLGSNKNNNTEVN